MTHARIGSSCLVGLSIVSACSENTLSPRAAPGAPALAVRGNNDVNIATVASLYAAVNDAANAGKRIVLAPGIYMLDGTRSNGGRIELQPDMTLEGQTGCPYAAVIDASNLSATALTSGGQSTGAVRAGRGRNTIEWLSVRNAVNGAAAITTDLFLAGATTISISHVVASGSARGFDIRNVGAITAGRTLEVMLTDNELRDNTLGAAQGMRIANLLGANGATIRAVLSRNYAHGNIAGCLAANVNTDDATINIESKGDQFEGNGNGCVLLGGNTSGASFARRNVLRFAAPTSSFANNLGPLGPVFPTRGGIAAYGGISTAANRAFDNRVELDLQGLKVDDNSGPDIAAWGAITSAAQPAGTGNTVSIVLRGSSKQVTVGAIDSAPTDFGGTNRVTIVR